MDYDEIISKLYLGAQSGLQDAARLRRLDVTSTVRCQTSQELVALPSEAEGWDQLQCAMVDDAKQDLISHALEAADFIEERLNKGEGVFVHCGGGKSRSASIVIAYLVLKRGMTVDDALALVKAKRTVANPSANFVAQLRKLEQDVVLKLDGEKRAGGA